jgi:hypothetical protein
VPHVHFKMCCFMQSSLPMLLPLQDHCTNARQQLQYSPEHTGRDIVHAQQEIEVVGHCLNLCSVPPLTVALHTRLEQGIDPARISVQSTAHNDTL